MSNRESDEGEILLVDDASSLAGHLEPELRDAGFPVTNVSTAADCISRVDQGAVDGVVSAFDLPDLDGIQLLRSVRISHPQLPFVLCPRDGSEAMAGKAVANGASGYVPWDDDPETAVSRLRGCMNRSPPSAEKSAESQHRYRHLIETSPAPINIFDEDGTSIWCNRALLDLFGFESRDEFIGRSIFDVIHPEDRDRARAELESVIDDKDSTGPTSMKLRTPDGTVKYIRVSTAIGTYRGADIGQAVAIDVTDREERNRQLQVLDQWLQHNVRNEVTIINGLAENIRTGSTDDIQGAAEAIESHTERLVQQADHERALTRILASAAEREPRVIETRQLVTDRVDQIRSEYPHADVAVEAIDDVDVEVIPDIGMAITELLKNAIQHNDRDEPTLHITIGRSTTTDRVVIRIADDGPGIPASERNALVMDREIDDLNHSSGLGLVLVYWVVRLSDGTIEFAENDPRGSVVTISLPEA